MFSLPISLHILTDEKKLTKKLNLAATVIPISALSWSQYRNDFRGSTIFPRPLTFCLRLQGESNETRIAVANQRANKLLKS